MFLFNSAALIFVSTTYPACWLRCRVSEKMGLLIRPSDKGPVVLIYKETWNMVQSQLQWFRNDYKEATQTVPIIPHCLWGLSLYQRRKWNKSAVICLHSTTLFPILSCIFIFSCMMVLSTISHIFKERATAKISIEQGVWNPKRSRTGNQAAAIRECPQGRETESQYLDEM